jgi:hypothetical protein
VVYDMSDSENALPGMDETTYAVRDFLIRDRDRKFPS